jgi:hypothetical protein
MVFRRPPDAKFRDCENQGGVYTIVIGMCQG